MNIINQIIKRNFFLLSFLILAMLVIYVGEVVAENKSISEISKDLKKELVESTISSPGESVDEEKDSKDLEVSNNEEMGGVESVEVSRSYQTTGEASKYQKPQENTVTLEIKSSIASGTYEIEIIDGQSTAFDVLMTASQEYGFYVGYDDYGGDLGVFVNQIANIRTPSDYSYFWCLYYNKEFSTLGASNLIMHINDTVSWKFIKSIW